MRNFLFGLSLAVFFVLGAGAGQAQEPQRKYMGSSKCKMCHKTAAQGKQFQAWQESPHANAYASLASDKAMEVAAKKGIKNPQTADECLKCHVTAHGVDAQYLGAKYAASDGVGCESCHGPGGDYYKKKTMVAVLSGKRDASSVGLVKPDEKTCVTCHNEESPFYAGFDFEKYWAKIKHTIPEERLVKYKTE